MPVRIGESYYENLELIRSMLVNLANGGYQEFPEVLVVENEGTCCYDKCPDKKKKADREVRLVYETGRRRDSRSEFNFFHARCLEKLLKDKRLEGMN